MIPKTTCGISDRKAWCFNAFPPLFGMCGMMTDSMIVKFTAIKVMCCGPSCGGLYCPMRVNVLH